MVPPLMLEALVIQPAGIVQPVAPADSVPLQLGLTDDALSPMPGDPLFVEPAPLEEDVSFADAIAADLPIPEWDDADAFVTPTTLPPIEPTLGDAVAILDPFPADPFAVDVVQAPVAAPDRFTPPAATVPPRVAATVPSTTLDPAFIPPTLPAGARQVAKRGPAKAQTVDEAWRVPTGPTVPSPPPATIPIVAREEWHGISVPLLQDWAVYRTARDVQADLTLDPATRAAIYADMIIDETRLFLVPRAEMASPNPTVVMVIVRAGTGLTSADAAARLAADLVTRDNMTLVARNSATWLRRPATEAQLAGDQGQRLLLVASLPGDLLVVLQTSGSSADLAAIHRQMATKLEESTSGIG